MYRFIQASAIALLATLLVMPGASQAAEIRASVTAAVFSPPQSIDNSVGPPSTLVSASQNGSQTIPGTFFTVGVQGDANVTTVWGAGSLVSNASGDITGDLSRVTSFQQSQPVLSISEQSEDLVFTWQAGFDDTQPIPVTLHRVVGYQANSSSVTGTTAGTGIFRIRVLDAIAPGSDTQATSLYNSLPGSGLTDAAGSAAVSVLNGGMVEVFAKLDLSANAIMTGDNPISNQGATMQYAFLVEVPVGVNVSAASGHDYTQFGVVPEPSSGALVAAVAAVCLRRRRAQR